MSWNVSAQINNLAAIVRTIQNTGLTNPLVANVNADGYGFQNLSQVSGKAGGVLNINADASLGVAVNAPLKTGNYAITTPTITAQAGNPLTINSNDTKGDGLVINSQATITTAQTGENALVVSNSSAPTNAFVVDTEGNVIIKGDPDGPAPTSDLTVNGAVSISKGLTVATSITAGTINYTTLNPVPISNPSPLSTTLNCANNLLTNVGKTAADATCALPIGQTQTVSSLYGILPFAGSGLINYTLPYGIGAFPTTANVLTNYPLIFPQMIGNPTGGTPASWWATPNYVLPGPAKLDFTFGFYAFPQDLTWATNVQGVMACITLVQGSLGSGAISSILGSAIIPMNYIAVNAATSGISAITGSGTMVVGPMTLNQSFSATNTSPIFIVQLYQANADFNLGNSVAVQLSVSQGASTAVPPQLVGGSCITTILPNGGAGY